MRIAILGGTFDPIHNGHLAAAQAVCAVFQADQVHFVPAFSPPHKSSDEMTSPFHRVAMVALALTPFERFRTSTIEVDTLERRYSVQTIELMRRRNPNADFIFIVGTDMYQEIETWKEYKKLFDLTHFAIVNRPGFPFREDVAPFETPASGQVAALPARKTVFYLPFVEQPISSTAIREACRQGKDASSWAPPQVWSYIQRNNLYS